MNSEKKELGMYKKWRIYCVSNNNSANIFYQALYDYGGQEMPLMKFSDNLESLKRIINQTSVRRF